MSLLTKDLYDQTGLSRCTHAHLSSSYATHARPHRLHMHMHAASCAHAHACLGLRTRACTQRGVQTANSLACFRMLVKLGMRFLYGAGSILIASCSADSDALMTDGSWPHMCEAGAGAGCTQTQGGR
eukprot:364089-Chlamydomonas_euryale.AAC.3